MMKGQTVRSSFGVQFPKVSILILRQSDSSGSPTIAFQFVLLSATDYYVL